MPSMPTLDDEPPETAQPGDGPASPRESRRLAEPPSARYAPRTPDVAGGPGARLDAAGSALTGPLARATLVALAGALLLTIVGAILASTAGLLFVAGAAGAAIGLVLSRAAVPSGEAVPVPRPRVAQLAALLALAAVVLAAVATWVYALGEGGTLGLVDYLLQTFGPFVPAEALLATAAAWWGATTGPVQS
jgi:hypothetical protein